MSFVPTSLILRFALLIVILPAIANGSAGAWNHGINGLTTKTSLHLALSAADQELLTRKWDEIGQHLTRQSTGAEGTYGNLEYENGYFLRISGEKGYILIPYFD